jgi:hypothetical protein
MTPRRVVECSNCHEPKPYRAHGWCGTCYSRWRRHSKPADGVPPSRCAGQDEIDHAAVLRAVTNDQPPPLTWAERREAVHAMLRRGMPLNTIAEQLGCNRGTIWRIARSDA